jgi:hypothetical protein
MTSALFPEHVDEEIRAGRQPAWRNLRQQLESMREVEYCALLP